MTMTSDIENSKN